MRNRPGNNNCARVPQRSGVAGLSLVPRLEELVADLEQFGVLDAHTTRVLKTQAITALLLLHNRDVDAARAETDVHMQRSKP